MKVNILENKTVEFTLELIELYKELKQQKEFVLSKQLLRSGISIGANVVEATAALTRKEFASKMSISSREARETLYWLKLLHYGKLADVELLNHMQNAEEHIKILTAIVKTSQAKLNQRPKH